MASVAEQKQTAGGRPKGALAKAPRNPDLILEIIRLKDQENHDWRSIGEMLGMTHQAPFLLYKRWRDWAYATYVLKKPRGDNRGAA